ncbi:class I SAM-dependent methyltransferase [Pseudomonas sp. PA27(2017)]|uniref:class I SAM-dependent methyltransferase n=1 Tax=Pseudomonas sp. PA27(2017) TaxID=1932112 RepID=UPI00096028DC|nr:class I SAM-dependent methyltransferase [Pseudomonas sp. PA27(2017)]OLU33795.1 hypothetical protein BVH06_07475 [Pseudomonas sp. PA27(2017)]
MKHVIDLMCTALPRLPDGWQLPPDDCRLLDCNSPGRLLATLERRQPLCALLSATQLLDLLDFAGLPLADLGALQRLIVVSEEADIDLNPLSERASRLLGCQVDGLVVPSAQQRHQEYRAEDPRGSLQRALAHPQVSAAALCGNTLHVVATGVPGGQVESGLAAVAEAVDSRFNAANVEQAVHLSERLEATALLSMLAGLQACGLLPVPQSDCVRHLRAGGIADRQLKLIRRWLQVLQHEGLLLARDGLLQANVPADQWSAAALDAAWQELEEDWHRNTGGAGTLEYARENAAHLPALMRGEVDAVHLLFPEGRTERAAALYRESHAAQYQHAALAEWVAHWAEERPSGCTARVLEVGAGTGSTTEHVLPRLEGHSIDYLCTDVSRFFNAQARETLRAWPWVRQATFNIDKPALLQGYATQDWDLIIAGGVLNAARDTDTTLAILLSLLKPGGWLVFSEPTREAYWVMASQAFMLEPASDERQNNLSTFLNLPQWRSALQRAGFDDGGSLPTAQHPLTPLGHRLFVARAPLARLSREALATWLNDAELNIELPDRLDDTANMQQRPSHLKEQA